MINLSGKKLLLNPLEASIYIRISRNLIINHSHLGYSNVYDLVNHLRVFKIRIPETHPGYLIPDVGGMHRRV